MFDHLGNVSDYRAARDLFDNHFIRTPHGAEPSSLRAKVRSRGIAADLCALQALTRSDVPDSQRVIHRATQDSIAARRECDTRHIPGVSSQNGLFKTSPGVPK